MMYDKYTGNSLLIRDLRYTLEISNPKKNNRIMALLSIGIFMGSLDIAIVGPALPAIKGAFPGVTNRDISWIFSIYILFKMVGTPLMSKLSDTFGRKWIYVADLVIFAIGSLITAFAPKFWFVLLGRGIQGFGAGGIFPVASAVIGDIFPPEKRGRALGTIGAVFGLAFIIGPVLAGVLLLVNWHWLFLINPPIAIVLIFFSIRILPKTVIAQKTSFDWAGMFTLAISLALLAFGVNQIDTTHFLTSLISLQVLPYILASLLLIPLFIFIESRAANPIIRLNLFSHRQMVIAYILGVGAGFAEAGLVFIPALTLAAKMVSSTAASSFLLMPVVIAMAIGSLLVGRLLDKFGSKLVIMSGTIIVTAGFVILGLSSHVLAFFIISGVFIGSGLSALFGAPIRYIVLNEAASEDRSVAQGVASLAGSIGQLLGASIIDAVISSGLGKLPGYDKAYLLIGGITFLLVFLTLSMKNHRQEQETAMNGNDAAK